MATITWMLDNIAPFRAALLSSLTPSDISSLMSACNGTMSDAEVKRYLRLSRELPEHQEWITHMTRQGFRVLLVGSGLTLLAERIRYPHRFERTRQRAGNITVWLVALNTREICMNHEHLDEYDTEHTYPSDLEQPHLQKTPSVWGEFYTHRKWYPSQVPNESGILVVFHDTTKTMCKHTIAAIPAAREIRWTSISMEFREHSSPILSMRPALFETDQNEMPLVYWYDCESEDLLLKGTGLDSIEVRRASGQGPTHVAGSILLHMTATLLPYGRVVSLPLPFTWNRPAVSFDIRDVAANSNQIHGQQQ